MSSVVMRCPYRRGLRECATTSRRSAAAPTSRTRREACQGFAVNPCRDPYGDSQSDDERYRRAPFVHLRRPLHMASRSRWRTVNAGVVSAATAMLFAPVPASATFPGRPGRITLFGLLRDGRLALSGVGSPRISAGRDGTTSSAPIMLMLVGRSRPAGAARGGDARHVVRPRDLETCHDS